MGAGISRRMRNKPGMKKTKDIYEENRRLRRELKEMKKENAF